MQLNRSAEVAIHGQAADMEWHLERRAQDQWVMEVEDLSLHPTAGRRHLERTLTDAQASATLALFVGEMEKDDELNKKKIYDIAEQVWSTVPQNLRVIP